MTNYELRTNIRERIFLILLFLSLCICYFLYPIVNALVEFIYTSFPDIKNFFEQWEYLGILTTQISVLAIFGILRWLFNNYLWKVKLLKSLLKVPDLNGIWEGVLESSYKDEDGNYVRVDMILIIAQTWEKISCRSQFPKSVSYCDMICIDTESSEGVVLKFTYTNKSRDNGYGLIEFDGYNEFFLRDANTLDGTYYTKRTPESSRGTMLLIRQLDSSIIHDDVTKTPAAKN